MDRWPISLQQRFNVQGFTKTLGVTTVTSETDVGPNKVRNRFTKGVDTYSVSINIDFSEYSTFETFYKTTLNNGTLPFIHTDPFTESDAVFRFLPGSSPSFPPIGGRYFSVNMVWEKLP